MISSSLISILVIIVSQSALKIHSASGYFSIASFIRYIFPQPIMTFDSGTGGFTQRNHIKTTDFITTICRIMKFVSMFFTVYLLVFVKSPFGQRFVSLIMKTGYNNHLVIFTKLSLS